MAYARFGSDGSDVYVFFNVDGFYECCGCIMESPAPWYRTANEMLEHMKAHRDRGDCVPEACVVRLLEDFWNEKRKN